MISRMFMPVQVMNKTEAVVKVLIYVTFRKHKQNVLIRQTLQRQTNKLALPKAISQLR